MEEPSYLDGKLRSYQLELGMLHSELELAAQNGKQLANYAKQLDGHRC